MPSSGAPNKPKINSGATITCSAELLLITNPGLAALPVARNSVEPTMDSMKSGKPSM